MRMAITRDISPDMADCELSFVDRSPIDIPLARQQHHAYQVALQEAGCQLITLPALAGYPDAVFVEDTALVFDELALMTRPGAESRRGEQPSIAAELARYRPLRHIEAPGTLDGGDVLTIGKRVFVGRSARSNGAGIDQLGAILAGYGYQVTAVDMQHCLHLKSAVTAIADRIVLINAEWVDRNAFADYQQVNIDPCEPHAANTLRIGAQVVYPAGFPRTRERIEAAGVPVIEVDLSELQKAEGATTCCSLLFGRSVA